MNNINTDLASFVSQTVGSAVSGILSIIGMITAFVRNFNTIGDQPQTYIVD